MVKPPEIAQPLGSLQIEIDQISGIHAAVPGELRSSYPTRLDNLLNLTPIALNLLQLSAPIGVVHDEEDPDRYQVIIGISTYGAIKAAQLVSKERSSRKPRKRGQANLVNAPLSVLDFGTLGDAQISKTAAAHFWLSLALQCPFKSDIDAVLTRAHELMGPDLLKGVTPELKSLRNLAQLLGQKSHAGLIRHKKKLPSGAKQEIAHVGETAPASPDSV